MYGNTPRGVPQMSSPKPLAQPNPMGVPNFQPSTPAAHPMVGMAPPQSIPGPVKPPSGMIPPQPDQSPMAGRPMSGPKMDPREAIAALMASGGARQPSMPGKAIPRPVMGGMSAY